MSGDPERPWPHQDPGGAPGRLRARLAEPALFVPLAALALWALVCVPAVLGRKTFYYRDLSQLIIPSKAFGAGELRAGRIPATDPTRALGQPFRGDPTTTAFYPGNALYLVLPFWSAFNLQLVLHWLLAGVAMALLSRALGQGRAANVMAGLTYAGSGWMLSALSFNTVAGLAAWLPLVLLGGVVGGRRGVALGGLALGLVLLTVDPVLGPALVPLGLLAIGRHGWRKGSLVSAAIVAAGAAVALPQIVATARIAPWTYRFGHGLAPAQVSMFTLHPARLLELLVPFPFGLPGHPGLDGVWAAGVLPQPPLYLSVYAGVVATLLAPFGARRRRMLAGLAVGGLLLASLGSWSSLPFQLLFAGAFRSPEKLVLWTALALPLLAAEGLERLVAGGGRALVPVALAGALAATAAATLLLLFGIPRAAGDVGRTHLVAQLAVAASLLLTAAWAARRSPPVLLVLQLVALLQLGPLVRLPDVADLRPAGGPFVGRAVVPLEQTYPHWDGLMAPFPGADRLWWQAQWEAFTLGPTPGVLAGRTYPVSPDMVGLHHRFYALLLSQLAAADWDLRAPWLRVLGVEVLVASEPVAHPDLHLLGAAGPPASPALFYGVVAPAPAAWWPRRAAVAGSPREALALLDRRDPAAIAAVPFPIEHQPGARLRLLRWEPDRIRIDVVGKGGLLVVRRAFQAFWRARSGGQDLQVVPADLGLLGVLVPPGRQQVELSVSAWPEWLAALFGLMAAVALGLLGRPWRGAVAPSPDRSRTS